MAHWIFEEDKPQGQVRSRDGALEVRLARSLPQGESGRRCGRLPLRWFHKAKVLLFLSSCFVSLCVWRPCMFVTFRARGLHRARCGTGASVMATSPRLLTGLFCLEIGLLSLSSVPSSKVSEYGRLVQALSKSRCARPPGTRTSTTVLRIAWFMTGS